MSTGEAPYSAQVRSWLKETMTGQDQINIPAIVDAAVVEFLNDPDFVRSWLHENIRPLAYQTARQIIEQSHQRAIITPDTILSESALAEHIRKRSQYWERFRQYDPLSGTHHLLMDMKRPQLLASIGAREVQIKTEIVHVEVLRKVAQDLPDDETPVREVYSAEELERFRVDLIERFDAKRMEHPGNPLRQLFT